LTCSKKENVYCIRHVLTSISLICIRLTIQPCVITTPPMCKFISVASLFVIVIIMLHFQDLLFLQWFHSFCNRAFCNVTLTCNSIVARKAFACDAVSAFKQTAQHTEFNRCKIQIEHMIRNFEIFHEYLLWFYSHNSTVPFVYETKFSSDWYALPLQAIFAYFVPPNISPVWDSVFKLLYSVRTPLQCSVYITVWQPSIDVI